MNYQVYNFITYNNIPDNSFDYFIFENVNDAEIERILNKYNTSYCIDTNIIYSFYHDGIYYKM